MSSKLIPVNELDFDTQVLGAALPVLVDVSTRWCGPCRALTPLLENLATEQSARVKIVTVDADESPGLSARLGVRGFPTIIAFDGGRETGRHLGLASLGKLRKLAGV